MVAGMRPGQQVLVAILDPAHRVIEFERQRGEDDFLRVEPGLGAEPAADIGRNDAKPVLVDTESFGNRDANGMRRLGRAVDHDLVEPVIAVGQHGAAFHRRPRLPVHPVFALDDDLRIARRRLDVAAGDGALDEEVVAPMLMDERAAGVERCRCVDHCVEHLEVDDDAGGDVFRLGAGRRDAGGDRLADIAHLVGGERRPGRRFGAARLRHDADRLHLRQVCGGEDAAACIAGYGNRPNARMRMRAAQEDHLGQSRHADVRDELPAAAQVPVVFLAQQRGADTKPLAASSRFHPQTPPRVSYDLRRHQREAHYGAGIGPGFKTNPDYRIVFERSPRRVRVKFNGETIADSSAAHLLFETRHLPIYYFPRADVRMELLRATEHHTYCPYKGTASYWSIAAGGRVSENAVWGYPEPFDEVAAIKDYVAFYWDRVDAWFEEDDEIFVHARDPYKRVDVVNSSRPVKVTVGGVTVAETRRARFLFETRLPTRYYIPPEDVRMDLLVPSEKVTSCPYKGTARYYSVRIASSFFFLSFPIPPRKPKNSIFFFFFFFSSRRITTLCCSPRCGSAAPLCKR